MDEDYNLISLDDLAALNPIPPLDENLIGMLSAIHLSQTIRASIDSFQPLERTRLSENCVSISGVFPEAFFMEAVKATFWIADREDEGQRERHFLVKFDFAESFRELIAAIINSDDLPEKLVLANGEKQHEASHAFAPDWQQSVSDLFYASSDQSQQGVFPPEILPDFKMDAGLNLQVKAGLLLAELFPGFALEPRQIPSIVLNIQHTLSSPRFQFLLELSDVYTESERSHLHEAGSNSHSDRISLKFDTFSISFGFSDVLKFQSLGVAGHIDTPFHEEDGNDSHLKFSADLDLIESRLSVVISDFPSFGAILQEFVPMDSPVLEGLNESGLDSLTVEELSFQLLLNSMHIESAGINVGMKKPLELFESNDGNEALVQLQPRFRLHVSNPLKKYRKVVLQLNGWAEMAGTRMQVAYHSEQQFMNLELQLGAAVNSEGFHSSFPTVKEALELHAEGDEDTMLQISDFRLHAWKTDQWNLALAVAVHTAWKFKVAGHEFSLHDLSLEAAVEQGALDMLDLQGRFRFGDLGLAAQAIYQREQGWILRGRSGPFNLELGDMLDLIRVEQLTNANHQQAEDLANHFNLDLQFQQIFFEANLPADTSEEEKNLLFILQIAVETETLPIPLDNFFLRLNWKEQLEWEAILHFTFDMGKETQQINEAAAATSLVLESKKEGDDLSFHGRLENLHISELISFFKERFGVDHEVHSALEDVVLNKLDISLTKTEKDWKFRFECDTQIIIDETPEGKEDRGVDLQLIFEVNKTVDEESHESEYAVEFDARALLHLEDEQELEFDVKLHGEKDNTWMLASYSGEANIPVSELLQRWLHLDGELPELSIDMTEACLLIQSLGRGDERKRRLLVGVELNAQLELKELSFFKTFLPDGVTAGVKPLRVAYASADFDKEALSTVSDALGEHAPLPKSTEEQALGKGFHLSAQLELGEFSMPFTVGPEAAPHEPSGNSDDNKRLETGLLRADPTPSSAPAALTKWFKVNQDIGPMHIGRVGIQFEYEVQKLWILLDAGLELAVIEASVTGLGFGSALSEFHAEVQLAGLGIDFHKGALEIGGALIFQKPSSEYPDATSFSGMVTLQFGDLGLSVFGSYTDKLGDPSLLLYGILNYPIGGPPFFFVEGLAAGVGINQRIIYPTIDKLDEFSLISAVTHPDDTKTLAQRLSAFEQDIHAELGSYFFAAGVQFSTFNLIHSFVLMILGIGEQVELDLLGYSALTMPKPEPGAKKPIDPVAEARLMIHAAFRPDAGTLKVEARLDPDHSYILSRKCKLQGGFAFYAWFEAEHRDPDGGQPGDFVLTLGGYHPHFRAESYYPQVPRLGFHWQVDKHMLFKGEFYFALTPGALMLGGLLSGNWKMDHFEAGFHLGLNMLIQWQPFHYGADAELSIRAAYRDGLFQVELELSTKVEIWGPEFGGTAHLKILFLEVDVDFGEAKEAMPAKLDWIAFAAAFLSPVMEDNKTVAGAFSASIVRGLVSKAERGEYYIGLADPSNPELLIESQVPFIIGKLNAKPEPLKSSNQEKVNEKLGIAPMDRAAIASELKIVVTHENQEVDYFQFESVLKNAPAALWGPSVETKLNDNATVDNCQFGYRLTLKEALSHPSSGSIAKALSDLNPIPFPGDVDRFDIAPLPLEWLTDKNAELEHNYDSDATRDFLEAFGLNAESKIGQQEFEAVERMNAFQPNALSTHE